MRFIFLIIFYSKLLLYNDLDCYNAESLVVRKRLLDFFLVICNNLFIVLLGGCSSVVERQIVDLVVVGSNPITHPFLRSCLHELSGYPWCS